MSNKITTLIASSGGSGNPRASLLLGSNAKIRVQHFPEASGLVEEAFNLIITDQDTDLEFTVIMSNSDRLNLINAARLARKGVRR